ncbi:MAG: hypothetical protein ACM3WU_09330 [Bacillota bacterium]
MASGQRNVRALEVASLVPNAVYYNATLNPPRTECTLPRGAWHGAALRALEQTDLVFLDPDNGLIVKSVGPGSAKSIKYVMPDELRDYYRSGKSVVFYNHRCRQPVDTYLERFRNLKHDPVFESAEWLGLAFSAWVIRDFILQPHHATAVRASVNEHLDGLWQERTYRLPI